MSHQTAKQLLEKAKSVPERSQAVKVALDSGMSLCEIEEFLDWLDMIKVEIDKSKKNLNRTRGDSLFG